MLIVRNSSDKPGYKLGRNPTKKSKPNREQTKSVPLGAQVLEKGFVTNKLKTFLDARNNENSHFNHKAFVRFTSMAHEMRGKNARYKQRPYT